MKTFVLALIVLVLLLGIVILSACSMAKTADGLLALLDQLPSAVTGSEAEFQHLLNRLHETWEPHRWLFRCFVGHNEADCIDDGLGELRTRYVCGDRAGYMSARRALMSHLAQIRLSEQFRVESLF